MVAAEHPDLPLSSRINTVAEMSDAPQRSGPAELCLGSATACGRRWMAGLAVNPACQSGLNFPHAIADEGWKSG
jgi:hypothetical protein